LLGDGALPPGDGDGDGDGGGDGTGVGDGDVLAHLVIPKGEHMKPSYKFIWYRGDQYAYCWGTNQETGMAMATATVAATEIEMEMATYWRTWSSRKVSQ